MNASPTEDDDTASEAGSVNSCEEFISFESIRDPSTNLEHCICLSWPGIYDESYASSTDGDSIKSHINVSKELRRIKLTTLLEEDDIAPIFDGSRWAGTRLWNAAVRGIQYITGHLESKPAFLEHVSPDPNQRVTMLELGCGLGVPGMIYHLLGGNVVLTDQANILGQLEKNVGNNFPESLSSESTFCRDAHSIRAMPLSWSKEGISELLDQLNLSEIGFDIVLNCDCVFEPLYGKSWMPLNETINELLRINPQCVVITSVERRRGDNIDSFLEMMRGMEFVGHVEQVWKDDERKPVEIYVTRGISR
eukprot:scaffold10076_cov69-Cyclotella_meneghiniana.AAC.1